MLRKDKLTRTYASNGNILTIVEPSGAATVFTYQAPGVVSQLTYAGKTVQFTWTGNRVTRVRDPNGSFWEYQYNANGMLSRVTAPGTTQDIRDYHYEASDPTLLTGISINGVRHTRYSYYPDRRVQESGLEGGEERDQFEYGPSWTKVTSAAQQPVTYYFATLATGERKIHHVSRAATNTCAAAAALTGFDANGYVSSQTDWNGHRTDYTHDAAGRLLRKVTSASTAADALVAVHTWSGNEISQTEYRTGADQPYLRVNYTYHISGGAMGRLATETWTDVVTGIQRLTTYSYTFHAGGVIASRTIARSLPGGGTATTTLNFDTAGNLIRLTNALGHQINWSNYNGLGLPGRMTDANGTATDYAYDPNGNLRTATLILPGGNRVTTYAYNNARQVTDIALATGGVLRQRYNAGGRLEYVGNAQNQFVQLGLDVPTNTSSTSLARHVPTWNGSVPVASPAGTFSESTQRDSLRRPWKTRGNAGQELRYVYDGNGNVLSRADAIGRSTSYEYDAQGRLKKMTAGDGGVRHYGYTPQGELAFVQDPRNLATTFSYNGFGQVQPRRRRA